MKEGWEIKKIEEISTVNPPKKDVLSTIKSDCLCSFLPMEDLGVNAYYTTPKQQRPFSEVQSSYTCFIDGDILLAKVSPCFENGKIGIADNLVNGIGFGSSEYLVIRSKENVRKGYLYHYLRSNHFVREATKNLTGTSGLRRVSKSFVGNYPIPIPPLAEQERIVAELDCLSDIIERLKQQLKELDNLAKSIFYTTFGDPISNNFGWNVKKLGEVCTVNPSKKDTSRHLVCSDIISFLPMEDLPIKACYYSPSQQRLLSEVQSSYTCFAENDILLAKVTPCFENGKVGIATELQNGVGYGSSEFIVLRPNLSDVVKEYIYYVVQDPTFKERACAQFTGTSGLRRVPRTFVENCAVSMPPLSLQQEFASKIEAIEKQKEIIKQSIEETETLFNSRMDYYFN